MITDKVLADHKILLFCVFFRSNANTRNLFQRKVGRYYPIMKLISFLWARLVSKFTLNFIPLIQLLSHFLYPYFVSL